IRDVHVTGVQTCALPIYAPRPRGLRPSPAFISAPPRPIAKAATIDRCAWARIGKEAWIMAVLAASTARGRGKAAALLAAAGMVLLVLTAAGSVGAQGLLTGGGGPMVELLLIDPAELGLPEMLVLQGGGGFGRHQAWRVGGYGAAGQTAPTGDGPSFSL